MKCRQGVSAIRDQRRQARRRDRRHQERPALPRDRAKLPLGHYD